MNNTSSLSLSCCISISDTVSRHKILIRIWNRTGKGRGKVKTFCWDESFLKCINALKQRDEKWMDVNQRAKKDHQSCKVWLGPVVYIWVWVGSWSPAAWDLRLNASTKFIKETLSWVIQSEALLNIRQVSSRSQSWEYLLTAGWRVAAWHHALWVIIIIQKQSTHDNYGGFTRFNDDIYIVNRDLNHPPGREKLEIIWVIISRRLPPLLSC